jgi:hypothetical protein
MSGWIVAIIVILALIAIGYYALYVARVEFCSIPVLGLICDITGQPSGAAQGQSCTADSDCKGWSVFGKVACCAGQCVTKDQSVETCTAFCDLHPTACPGHSGGGQQPGAACGRDWDCTGWSLFGDVACCAGHCVTKDQSVETCATFCANHPSECESLRGRPPGGQKRLSMQAPRRRSFI